ncbi:MAG TPA: class I SAM-dependent methyltransferase [Nitrospinaceae bacterium]|nr:class I SAM-dependent methyltransferase [Nitrospinaceae bacterium]
MHTQRCRICGSSKLAMFLDLGFSPPADQFKRKDQLKEEEVYYPLEVCICEECCLVQLNYVVSPEVLYRNDYPYESSTTKTGRKHWEAFAERTVSRFNLINNDLVVDIGSNVGVLLEFFKERKLKVQGVDPAANIVLLAKKRGINTICDFFNQGVVETILKKYGKAMIITATNNFAHVDDLENYMENVQRLMADNGIFIFEAPYLASLIRMVEYDTIYHEHLSYLSVKPLVSFFRKFEMEIFDIEQVDIHGGSFRAYVGYKGQREVSDIVDKVIIEEENTGLYSMEKLREFANKVKQNKKELQSLLFSLKNAGKSIVGVSAPAKGMTLLNYCGIGKDTLDVITEKSELKIGRFSPGMHIPIVPDSYLLDNQPDYALLLAWNFAEEIISNLNEFKLRGGKFIIPVPVPKII